MAMRVRSTSSKHSAVKRRAQRQRWILGIADRMVPVTVLPANGGSMGFAWQHGWPKGRPRRLDHGYRCEAGRGQVLGERQTTEQLWISAQRWSSCRFTLVV